MTDETPAQSGLHVVPDPDDAATALPPDDGTGGGTTDVADEHAEGDPLLARAQRVAELPLADRPAAFDGLNRALVAELQTLEEG